MYQEFPLIDAITDRFPFVLSPLSKKRNEYNTFKYNYIALLNIALFKGSIYIYIYIYLKWINSRWNKSNLKCTSQVWSKFIFNHLSL